MDERRVARLDAADLEELTAVRRRLHAAPELSGEERCTASAVVEAVEAIGLDELVTGLGGHGVAALLRGDTERAVIVRCELDALPIAETVELAHGSRCEGVAHKCGHDGHMAIVLGVGWLQRRLLMEGSTDRSGCLPSLVLLFQPAEETGDGAAAVLADGRLDSLGELGPAIALHNLPGYALGSVLVREGAFACASVGVEMELEGTPAHSAYPETGRSVMAAIGRLVSELAGLGGGGELVTVVHASGGERAFGIAPGSGVVLATARAETSEALDALVDRIERFAADAANREGLGLHVSHHERFPALMNDDGAVEAIRRSGGELGAPVLELAEPMRFSEDFAHLAARYGGAMFGLGAGEDHPALHDERYDFPDALIPIGASMLYRIARRLSVGE